MRIEDFFNIADCCKYEQIKDKLFIRLKGKEENIEMLSLVPHVDIHDIAIVYNILISYEDGNISSMVVTNDMMKRYHVSIEQLHADAVENSALIMPASVRHIKNVIEDIVMEPCDCFDDCPLYVVSNKTQHLGASAIFYSNIGDYIKSIGRRFYVFPSSVHEMLLYPYDSSADVDNLYRMVKEINSTLVDAVDKLTDSVYCYDAYTKEFNIMEVKKK